jgi:two-component system, NarL family, sensor histidine kinase DegS
MDSYDSYDMTFDKDQQEDSLLDEIRRLHESIQNRIKESRGQLEQNQAQVERYAAELNKAKYSLDRVQAEFETIPRQEIRVAYDNMLDLQKRQTTINAHLERLHDNLEELERFEDIFRRLLQELEGQQFSSGSSTYDTIPQRATLSASGETIIRIVEAQEDERQVLAKQLHDGPAQSLSNFILQAEVCQRLFDRDPDRAASELNNLKTAATDSFQKVRDFIFDLRPMMLDDLGLIPTLRRYTENIQQKNEELTMEFRSTSEEHQRVSKHTEVMMFRGIQQLLALTREYLKATRIAVQVDIGSDEVRAIVEDNGKGFDPETELNPQHGDSNMQVLNALRDRIELVNGEIDIFSSEGEGSRFAIMLPLLEDAEPDF